MATKYRSIIRAVLSAQWAILPEKLSAIVDVLNVRASGIKPSKEEIAARLNGGGKRAAIPSTGSVAVLNIWGTIAQHVGAMQEASGGVSADAIGRAFDEAMNDPNVGTIVLNIDSPGGTVAGTPELAAKIYAARGKKRVVAVANSLAASAAYWIGSAAEEFIVVPSASVGSVGVLYVHTDESAALDKMGVKETVISAGKFKAEGYGPLTDEAKAAIQERVNYFYDMFTADVAKHRGVSVARVKQDYGQGRVLTAEDAVRAGMVDKVATLDQVFLELGVAKAADSRRADVPAFSLEGLSMNPELFGALVRAGMCAVTASQAEAENAVLRFYAATGKTKPADEAAQASEILSYAQTATANVGKPAVINAVSTERKAVAAERAEEILAAVKIANIPNAFDVAQSLIADSTLSVKDALKKIDEEAAKARKPAGPSFENGVSEKDKFQAEAKSAVLGRVFGANVPKQVFDFRAGEYVDFNHRRAPQALGSLPRLAEECLVRDGFSASALRNLTTSQIAQLAMGVVSPDRFGLRADGGPYNTTGTFSNLLLDAANVTLRKSYDDARTTFQSWMKRAPDINDFKNVNRVIGGELGDPRAIPEGAEFEETTHADGKESYALRVWGQIFHISWQAVVNDQLNAFTEIPMKQGRGMKRKQNRLAYSVLKDNATMADTGALFNSTAVTTAGGHANLTTGSATPGVSTLNTMCQKMLEQKGLNTADGSALNIMPRFIVACPALRGTILELLGSSSYAVSNGNAGIKNIWENGLEPIIDAELGVSQGGSDTAWYLAADPAEIDTIEYAYLSGGEAPTLDSEASFDRLAIKYRIYQAFAVKAIDYRGLQKHAGA